MPRTLGQLFPGSIIALEYNGQLENWIVTNDSNENRTILLRDTLLPARRMHSSNVSVYSGCETDAYLENESTGYLSGFDEATRHCLVSTAIETYTYGDTTPSTIARRCFIPSEDNLFGNNAIETETWWIRALMEAKNTDTASTARIGRDLNDTAQNWWLRSPFSAAQFRGVFAVGTAGYVNAANSYYLRPALSVASATIVSDEGAEIVRLLPDPSKTYREVICNGIAGSIPARPKTARVLVDAINLYDVRVRVSNNAGDANPAWVDAPNGDTVELTNTEKTTDEWKIGVELSGKSNSIGYFTQPVVLVEEDN